MSKQLQNNNQDWSQALGEMMRETQISTPSNGWERLEGALPAIKPRPKQLLWRAMAVAASLMVGLLVASMWFMDDIVETIAPIDELAENQQTIEDQNELLISEVIDNAPEHIDNIETPESSPKRAEIRLSQSKQPSVVKLKESTQATKKEQKEITTPPKQRQKEESSTTKNSDRPLPKEVTSKSKYRNTATANSSSSGGVKVKHNKRTTRVSLAMNSGVSNSSNSNGTPPQMDSSGGYVSAPTSSSMVFAPYGYDPDIDRNYTNSKKTHSVPVGFALSVGHDISDRFAIESGISYTYLHSTIQMPLIQDPLDQNIHFVGVPLRINYKFYNSQLFNAYVGTGVIVERAVYAELGELQVNEDKWQFAYGAVLGAQYNINKWLGLYCEPVLSCYTSKTQLESIRTDSPLTFSLRVGLRFNL